MKDSELVEIALIKSAVDLAIPDAENPELTKSLKERLAKLTKENLPKGLPNASINTDETDPDYPTEHTLPKDMGWAGANLISGTGPGPEFLTKAHAE